MLEALWQLGTTEHGRLVRWVAEAVGFERLSTAIRECVEGTVEHLKAGGEVFEVDGLLYVRQRKAGAG